MSSQVSPGPHQPSQQTCLNKNMVIFHIKANKNKKENSQQYQSTICHFLVRCHIRIAEHQMKIPGRQFSIHECAFMFNFKVSIHPISLLQDTNFSSQTYKPNPVITRY